LQSCQIDFWSSILNRYSKTTSCAGEEVITIAVNLQELPQTDEELVILAQNGDKQSMDYILRKYRFWAYSLAKSYFISGADREGIFQEGFIGLYKAVKSYKPGRTSFKTFAKLCIIRNVCTAVVTANRCKHAPLSEATSLDKPVFCDNFTFSFHKIIPAAIGEPEKYIITKENREILIKFINTALSTLERNAFKHFLEGKSYREIAYLVGESQKAVDNALYRARKKIKTMVSSELNC
jgi:RNA polymerase sporulation-specific sigma factor